MFVIHIWGISVIESSCKVGHEFVGCSRQVQIPHNLCVWVLPIANFFINDVSSSSVLYRALLEEEAWISCTPFVKTT